jgi:hypothetical protein
VEHLDDRRAPRFAQRQSGDAGQPVVRVDEVVVQRLVPAKRLDAGHELIQVAVDFLARHRGLGPGTQVDHTCALTHVHDPRNRRILGSRENVDVSAHAAQLAGRLSHVDVHAARLLAARRCQRTGVNGQHRDAKLHGRTLTW